MENNNETIWITIPEETTPALQLPLEEATQSFDRVRNKTFWGAGLIALIFFVVMLFTPQKFLRLMEGNLFDGGFQVVPDYEEQQGNPLLSGGTGEGEGEEVEEASAEDTIDETVVGAESDAVNIQIEPLEDTDAEVTDGFEEDEVTSAASGDTSEGEGGEGDEESEEDEGGGEVEAAGASVEPTSTGTGSSTGTIQDSFEQALSEMGTESEDATASDEDTAETSAGETSEGEVDMAGTLHGASEEEGLETEEGVGEAGTETEAEATGGDSEEEISEGLQGELDALKAELEAFRDMEEENQALITQLTELLQGQNGSLYGAAGTQGEFGALSSQGGYTQSSYRYNTHTVTVSPYEILKQNKTVESQIASQQANIAYAGATAYSNQAYNPVLAEVQGQPDTGPAETLLIAFLFASVGILIWGVLRAARA